MRFSDINLPCAAVNFGLAVFWATRDPMLFDPPYLKTILTVVGVILGAFNVAIFTWGCWARWD